MAKCKALTGSAVKGLKLQYTFSLSQCCGRLTLSTLRV